jgi:hypothetical protein
MGNRIGLNSKKRRLAGKMPRERGVKNKEENPTWILWEIAKRKWPNGRLAPGRD